MIVDRTTLLWLAPEMMLVAAATWLFLGGTWAKGRLGWTLFASAAYAMAGWFLLRKEWPLLEQTLALGATGPLMLDLLGHLVRWLALALGLLMTWLAVRRTTDELSTEWLGTLMLMVVGVMLVARANELVFLFVSLELVSIPTYVLLFLGRRDRATSEATAKYFFLSILSSAVLLYGMSFLYGVSGTTLLAGTADAPGMRELLAAEADSAGAHAGVAGSGPLVIVGLVLVVGGLGFKIAAVPFHFYAPDVYQGTTNANAGLLALAPKIAGMVALVRVLGTAGLGAGPVVWQLVLVVSVLTMTLGNVCALWQNNVRRLLAYSSIAHGGYMLVGLSAALAGGAADISAYGGVAALLLYLLVYGVAALGAFATLAALSSNRREVSRLDELSGLARTRPLAATAMAVFMFSLAGIPPLAGFWGKLALFKSAIDVAASAAPGSTLTPWFIALAVFGVINAAVAAAYYLRIVATMFLGSPEGQVPAKGGAGAWATVVACAMLVGILGAMPGGAARLARQAERSLGWQSAARPSEAATAELSDSSPPVPSP